MDPNTPSVFDTTPFDTTPPSEITMPAESTAVELPEYIGKEDRLRRLIALGFSTASYHCNDSLIYVLGFYTEVKYVDPLILLMEKYGKVVEQDFAPRSFYPQTRSMAALAKLPYEDDNRKPEDVLKQWAKWFQDQADKKAEEDQIFAATPMQTGRHDIYAEAMRLVGNRKSKSDLVELVNWLLWRLDKATL